MTYTIIIYISYFLFFYFIYLTYQNWFKNNIFFSNRFFVTSFKHINYNFPLKFYSYHTCYNLTLFKNLTIYISSIAFNTLIVVFFYLLFLCLYVTIVYKIIYCNISLVHTFGYFLNCSLSMSFVYINHLLLNSVPFISFFSFFVLLLFPFYILYNISFDDGTSSDYYYYFEHISNYYTNFFDSYSNKFYLTYSNIDLTLLPSLSNYYSSFLNIISLNYSYFNNNISISTTYVYNHYKFDISFFSKPFFNISFINNISITEYLLQFNIYLSYFSFYLNNIIYSILNFNLYNNFRCSSYYNFSYIQLYLNNLFLSLTLSYFILVLGTLHSYFTSYFIYVNYLFYYNSFIKYFYYQSNLFTYLYKSSNIVSSINLITDFINISSPNIDFSYSNISNFYLYKVNNIHLLNYNFHTIITFIKFLLLLFILIILFHLFIFHIINILISLFLLILIIY